MKRSYLIIINIVMLLTFVVVFVACSRGGSEESLEKRVTQAWDARMNADGDALYALTTDSYKETVPKDSFV